MHQARTLHRMGTEHAAASKVARLLAMVAVMALVAAVALLTMWPRAAHAHKASDAYLWIDADAQGATLRADIALRDLDRELVLDADDDGSLRWAEVRHRSADIEALASQALNLTVSDQNGKACEAAAYAPLQIERHSDGSYAVLTRSWRCAAAPKEATLSYGLFASTDPSHRGLLVMRMPTTARTWVLTPGSAPTVLPLGSDSRATSSSGLTDVFLNGVHHIWTGFDHVLFLAALLLPAVLRREGGAWRAASDRTSTLLEVVGVVTAFSVAHSITLALAVFDLVNPPSRWIESLIALSVLLAALNNIWPVILASRWRLTFGFGLIHGFGFAGALKDMGLGSSDLLAPLLLFNLGVEAGQLVIVAVLIPLAWAARSWMGYPRWVLNAGSVAVASLASVWMIERCFDLRLLAGAG